MLGFVTIDNDAPGAADRILAEAARLLAERGVRLAGAVQFNIDHGPDRDCDMDLRILGDDGPEIRISQSLGSCSQGCRLDTDALMQAAGRIVAVLDGGADLVILNKFGKQESRGGGFREVIARALDDEIPVLLYVPPEMLADFHAFAGDLAQPVSAASMQDWCLGALDRPAA